MSYRSLQECTEDLRRHGHLREVDHPIESRLVAAAVQRRLFAAGGPAVLMRNLTGTEFPVLANLYGTPERVRFLFRHSLDAVRRLVEIKSDPENLKNRPLRYVGTPLTALTMLPRTVRSGPVTANETTVSRLPQITSWPHDGGAFVTLPQVYTEDPRAPGLNKSNLGMYRVQLSGNEYATDAEIGLHYQTHRSIGVHHQAARELGKPLHVNIFVGGPPSMAVSAVMPLPEGMSELTFAGALGKRRVRMIAQRDGASIHADADFCICGTIEDGRLLPEGPFGDHLGYYALEHDFPVLKVHKVYHRDGAIWPFTVVGRPPQEDTMFGELIHEITGPLIPTVLPGVEAVHAVDAAGVHPLLLAVGSERYMPFLEEQQPQELLTQAHAILGQGQLSLAKFLLIAARQDDAGLDIHDIGAFLAHILRRANWTRDLHFHTQTTIDTLDYSGFSVNKGSKLVIAATGPPVFELATEVPPDLQLPEGFANPVVALPGVLAVEGPRCPAPSFDYDVSRTARARHDAQARAEVERFCGAFAADASINRFRWVLVVDDSRFVAESLNNLLWAVFTRANPATDVSGIGAFIEDKHWGCRGALVIDARIKAHHAPVVEEDPETTAAVEALAAPGGPLHGLF